MLYIFSPDEQLVAILKPDFSRSSGPANISRAFLSAEYPAEFDREPTEGCPYWDAVHREVLNGENTFKFAVPAGSEYVVEGNLVAFRDLDSYWQLFEIKRVVDLHGDGFTRTAFCEHIFYELLDDIVTDKRPSADATDALAGMLENTRWQAGVVDDLGTSSTSAYYISALEAVQKVADAWQGELNWRCVINGGVITRYVDLLAMRGTDTGKQFAYSKDILNIEREVDSSNVVTALYGRGKGVETESGAYGRRLTFADVEAPGKPLGQEWIGDNDALARWGRPGGRHRFDVFIDEEETDPVKLLEKTRAELAKRTTPRVTYRLDVVSLEELTGYEHEKVRLGDLVRVIDREFKPELVVSARVVEIERDLLDPANTKVVLGSFAPTIVEATINTAKRLNEMANRPFNTKWLDGKINVLQNAIENTQSYVFQTGEDGILILDAPTYEEATKAMKLGGGIFAIANQKDGNGGWNWRTFGDGSGFTADLITAGMIDAGLVQIGPQTTFAPGYDPSQIEGASAVGMGVDADCTGLWHFDGSLNSHKGVPATFTRASVAYLEDGTEVEAGQPRFETGKFGQAVLIEEGTTNLATAGHRNIESLTGIFIQSGSPTISISEDWSYIGTKSLKVVGSDTSNRIKIADTISRSDTSSRLSYSAYIYNPNSTSITVCCANYINGYVTIPPYSVGRLEATTPAGVAWATINEHIYENSGKTFYLDAVQIEEKPYATSFVDGTRSSETLTIPSNVLNPQEGTVECWVYVNDIIKRQLGGSSNGMVISIPRLGGSSGIYLTHRGDSPVWEFRIYADDNTYTTKTVSNSYTPNGWHFFALRWSLDRADLFIDGVLRGTISNPKLPSGFYDIAYVGCRGSGYHINTLFDELRIDKIARTDEEIAAWYKANAPFYTSEDMKQWPGYMKLETDGLKVYDSSNALRVLIGSWLKDAVRKYGIKINNGEIYSTLIRSGEEGATSYIELGSSWEPLKIVQDGKEALTIWTFGNGGHITFSDIISDVFCGEILPKYNSIGLLIRGRNGGGLVPLGDVEIAGKQIILNSDDIIFLENTTLIWGDLEVMGIISSSQGKSAIEPTDNYGTRYLYCVETPELKYYDSNVTYLINGEATVQLDPIFLECIEPDTELTPWQIWVQCYGENDVYVSEVGANYFKVKERNGGVSNNKVIWRFEATRKNYAGIRLMEVTN